MEELDSLRAGLLEGRLDRGTFLKKAVALGISLPAASVLLASWGRGLTTAAEAATATARWIMTSERL